MPTPSDMTGKAALVTGAAAGLGRATALRLARAGAQLIFSPAITFGEQSRRMWDLEFPVDAARARVFIGGLNRLGVEPPWEVEYFGASYFVGPDGVLPDLSSVDELVIADLDLASLDTADSSGWNLQRDARPDIYLA